MPSGSRKTLEEPQASDLGSLVKWTPLDFRILAEIVAPEGDGLELADAVFVAFGGEEGQAGFGAGEEFDPASFTGEGLVSDDFEAEGFGEELQRNILIANGDADELRDVMK